MRLPRMLALLAPAVLALAPARRPEVRVLFIGNSYTYYHNMPRVLEALAAARSEGPELFAESVVAGGATLQQHWREGRARAAIERGGWSFVVLQAQSTFGETFFVDGLERVGGAEGELAAMREFSAAITAAGARTVLAAHWKRREAPERDGAALEAIFAGAARELGARVAPLGDAWREAHAALPALELYDADGSHPSPAGSYLDACTFLATLLDAPPGDDLPSRVRGPAVDDEGVADAAHEVALVELEPAAALELGRAAQRARDAWRRRLERAEPEPVPPLELPSVPPGDALDADELLGVWEGELRLYPRYLPFPAKLRLELDRPEEQVVAAVTVSFGGRPEDIRFTAAVELGATELVFVDPDGPNETRVRYRASARGDVLSGVAEFEGDPSLRGIGAWRATRSP